MPEVKKMISIGGRPIEVYEIPIVKSNESWAELTLEDGAVLRVKSVPTSALRIEGQKNPLDGSPVYMVLTTPVVTTVNVAEKQSNKAQ